MILTIQDTIRRILRECTAVHFQSIRVKIKCHRSIMLFCNNLVEEETRLETGIDNKSTVKLIWEHLDWVARVVEAKLVREGGSSMSLNIHYSIRLHKQNHRTFRSHKPNLLKLSIRFETILPGQCTKSTPNSVFHSNGTCLLQIQVRKQLKI